MAGGEQAPSQRECGLFRCSDSDAQELETLTEGQRRPLAEPNSCPPCRTMCSRWATLSAAVRQHGRFWASGHR